MQTPGSGQSQECTLTLSASRVGVTLVTIIAFLLAADLAGQIATYRFGHPSVMGLVTLFDLDSETNIPSWYSSSALLVCAVVLALIAAVRRQQKDRFATHWTVLALGFVYLSADESAGIHEVIGPMFASVGRWLTRHVDQHFAYLGAYPVYTWILPASVAVLAVGLWYLKFLLALPRRYGILFFLGAVIFLGGSMGMEVVGARHVLYYGQHDPTYGGFVALEETMEMSGIALFLVSLLSYARAEVGPIQIRVGAPAAEAAYEADASPKDLDPLSVRRSA
jgi:hypothetical protein